MVGEINVVVVGDTNVGKSSLINTHCPPITGVHDASIAVVSGIAFVLCDTFGAQRFRTLTSGFYRHARGVLIVYDVSDRESYEHVPHWMSEVRLRTHASMPVVVVANKCDVPPPKRVVSSAEAQSLCAEMEVGYTETSAHLYSAQADVGGALTHALRLLMDRIPHSPTIDSKLSQDRKRRRHRSLVLRGGQKFVLPPEITVKKKKKKRTCILDALRRRCRKNESPPPIYDLSSVMPKQ